MHLHELMGWPGPLTWRQYTTWRAWLEMEWNRPSRDNYYQMQTTAVMEALHSRSRRVDLARRVIPFRASGAAPAVSREERLRMLKEEAIRRACGGKTNLVRRLTRPGG